jgi:CBS domain-containing protein
MICPFCGHQNLDGLDHCDECMHDLSIFDVPAPTGGLQQHLMEDKVSHIPYDRLVLVSPDDSVAHAVSRIKTIGIGQAVVVDGGRLVGILTERDLLGAVAGRVHTSEARVREWMTVDPVTASSATTAEEALKTMLENGFRHLPVVEEGRTIGVISLRELIRSTVGTEAAAGS